MTPRARLCKWSAFVLVVGLYGGALWASRGDIPLTDDAGFYLGGAQVYKAWYAEAWRTLRDGHGTAFRPEVIDAYWGYNWVHPPLGKIGLAAGIALFHDRLYWLDEIDAARTAVLFLSTLLAALMFLICWPTYGPLVAIGAPLLLLVMPRFFFDSHVESLDVPSAATYFLAVFCFWRARTSTAWSVRAGVASGLAMSTKINGALAVVPLGILWMWEETRRAPGTARDEPGVPHPPLALVLMVTLGPLLAVLLWPWLWTDTAHRLARYLRFYIDHHPSRFHYFGTTYEVPFAPWHAPFVMTAITTPLPVLALALPGASIALRRAFATTGVARSGSSSDVPSLDRLILLNAAVTIGAAALPNVPKYGGVKLFAPFFPFLAILAGIGLDALARAAGRRMGGNSAVGLAGAITLAVVVGGMGIRMKRLHPYHLSYYNALVGGLAGAERWGFETQYYDLWYLELARWLNRTYPDGVRVFFQPNNKEYLRHAPWYYRARRLEPNVVIVNDESRADIVVLTHERRWPEYPALRDRLGRRPVLHELVVDGVPLLTVYAGDGHP